MRLRKNTPTIVVPACELRAGQMIVANSGNVVEVTPAIKRALPPAAGVKVYAS